MNRIGDREADAARERAVSWTSSLKRVISRVRSTSSAADRSAMTTSDDFLPGVLLQQVKQAARTAQRETLLDYAIHAATEPDRNQRAWALVSLAKQLRGEEQHERALTVLDAAVAINPTWEAQSAAFTLAAIHCDRNELDKARAICDETLARGVNVYVLKTAARVYWELAQSTKVQELYDKWKSISDALEQLETSAATS